MSDDTADPIWWYQSSYVGGDGGGDFEYLMYPVPVISLTTWSDQNAICGLEFVLADGSTHDRGIQKSNKKSIFFQPGEMITSLSMMKTEGIGGHECVGQMHFKTNKGQDVTMGPGGTWSYDLSVASGLIVGWKGRNGDYIDSICFFFLQPVRSVNITIHDDAAWNAPLGTGNNLQQTIVAQQLFVNQSEEPMDWTFDGTQEVTSTNTFSQSATKTYGDTVSVEVSAGLFGIVDVKASNTFQWSRAETTSQEVSTSTTSKIGRTISETLPKDQKVSAFTACQLGKLNINYSSDVQLIFQDPGIPSVTYFETGVFDNANYNYGYTSSKTVS